MNKKLDFKMFVYLKMVVYLKKKQDVSQNQGPQHEEDENEQFNPVMEATIAISIGCEDMSQENLTFIAAGRYKAMAPRFYMF